MADNVAISAGSGTSVATDDVSGQHYQRVKISDGTADSATHLKVVAEDAAHTSGDTGLVLMAVRQDTAAALGDTDADYMPLIVDSTGRLWVQVGASALPTGAATSAKQDTEIGHLATLAGAVGGTEVQADIVSSALPTGAATAANQTTIIGHVDGVETLLGTIDADTGTLAGAVAGNEVQVDVVGALPAGTNNIGDVDVASVTLPTAIYSGKTMVTTAGTQVALATSQAILSGVTVKALAANTGIIYVGNSGVSSTDGLNLAAGEQIFIEVANLATVYIDASVTGTEGVSYIAT